MARVRATPRYCSAGHVGVTRRSSGASGPRPLAGLYPAPTRERAHFPLQLSGNGIPTHIHVRGVASFLGALVIERALAKAARRGSLRDDLEGRAAFGVFFVVWRRAANPYTW